MADMTWPQEPDPIAVLSNPELIRERLARAVNEADVLRRALRIAERAAQAEAEQTERAKNALAPVLDDFKGGQE